MKDLSTSTSTTTDDDNNYSFIDAVSLNSNRPHYADIKQIYPFRIFTLMFA